MLHTEMLHVCSGQIYRCVIPVHKHSCNIYIHMQCWICLHSSYWMKACRMFCSLSVAGENVIFCRKLHKFICWTTKKFHNFISPSVCSILNVTGIDIEACLDHNMATCPKFQFNHNWY